MKRILDLGTFRKENSLHKIKVLVELKENEDHKPVFFADVKVPYKMGFDEIRLYAKNNHAFNEVYRLWKNYNLNDLHAGTEDQERALTEWHQKKGTKIDYVKDREYLEENGMLIVDHNGESYQYGMDWIYYEIPSEDLEIIKKLIATGEV